MRIIESKKNTKKYKSEVGKWQEIFGMISVSEQTG
jgi:hypothetical protein